tara:strand:+ start:1577 stop:2056 length:480 start_codon:yes stop_codon:yes gene_type:complete
MALTRINNQALANVTSAGLPTGSVLQVVSGTTTTQTSVTGSTFVDTGLTASITPSSSSSKILIIASQQMASNNGGSAGSWQIIFKLMRGSTDIYESHRSPWLYNQIGIGTVNSISYLDSPTTTSSVTYKTQARNGSASGNMTAQMGSSLSSMILMEIAG